MAGPVSHRISKHSTPPHASSLQYFTGFHQFSSFQSSLTSGRAGCAAKLGSEWRTAGSTQKREDGTGCRTVVNSLSSLPIKTSSSHVSHSITTSTFLYSLNKTRQLRCTAILRLQLFCANFLTLMNINITVWTAKTEIIILCSLCQIFNYPEEKGSYLIIRGNNKIGEYVLKLIIGSDSTNIRDFKRLCTTKSFQIEFHEFMICHEKVFISRIKIFFNLVHWIGDHLKKCHIQSETVSK